MLEARTKKWAQMQAAKGKNDDEACRDYVA
jgi:hypothetical protein